MLSKFEGEFNNEYKRLNKYQKEAVDSIDGPVMVIAGPGTGKTQILALHIGNILKKTQVGANGILCLTFTNAAVDAMKHRLKRYIGEVGEKVNVHTFHSFGIKVLEKHYEILGLKEKPKLLVETDQAILFEQILVQNDWEYISPRGGAMRYFEDLKSLISLLKRERISANDFARSVKTEIKNIENDEENISKRGENKGALKKETLKELEGLMKTREVAKFLDLYENAKKKKNLFDYDDVLENLVKLVEISKDVVSEIRESYLYVLIDEHQDSSRVQNEFLKKVWAPLEKPDIFVVGDDRQLIYGFSGASIEHFAGFRKTFKNAKLITLVDNYRSTQVILDAAHALLPSVMSDKKLMSQNKIHHPIKLIETQNEEAEILVAGSDIKAKIKDGVLPSECAVLVPKNAQARRAMRILHDLGVPISTTESVNLFDEEKAQAFLRVMKIMDTGDPVSLALSFFDPISGLTPIEAHKFLSSQYMREFSLDKFTGSNPWMEKILKLRNVKEKHGLASFISLLGKELFTDNTKELTPGEGVVNTILSLLAREQEKDKHITFSQFVTYLEKLQIYGEFVPIVGGKEEGVKVLTMHGSKGLEFDYVWIAHMDERSLSRGRKLSFALPEDMKNRIEERDMDAIKRKLFVAITRAKRFCTLSYSILSKKENEQELAKIIAELPEEVFQKATAFGGVPQKAGKNNKKEKASMLPKLVKLVADKYKDRYVSASMLNNFFECPWKWYFSNLLQLPEPKNEHFIFGSKVHGAIDRILKENKVLSEREILEILDGDKEVAEIITKWVKNRFPEIAKDHKNEYSISFLDPKFPYLKIYGRIDLVEKLDDDNVRVTDFKTGSAKRKSEIEKMDEEGRQSNLMRQLAMYSYLLENNKKWNGVNVRESRLEFLEAKGKDGIYNYSVTKDDINLLLRDIADYDEFIKDGTWTNRPCHFKSYGKNTECEYCKLAEIYTGKTL